MGDTLVQKHLFHGTQELRILDDVVKVKISKPLRGEKELDFVLASLNPEPVLKDNRLEFYGRVKCGPMISLYLNKPDPETFDAFVAELTTRIRKEYGAFTGWKDPSA